MVDVIRSILGALVFAALAACATAHAQNTDMSGVWVAAEVEGRYSRDGGFRAELTQDSAGRLSGVGAVDPCPLCAGFMSYDLSWEGGFEGDVLVLTGTPARVSGRWTIVRFEGRAEGDGFVGMLSGLARGETMRVRMERLPPGE
ncbi:MAG TPA: hypothetical protein PKY87_02610 [Terricaulis sp.]|nr:hypothetical protein [Terricaulis sp.]